MFTYTVVHNHSIKLDLLIEKYCLLKSNYELFVIKRVLYWY